MSRLLVTQYQAEVANLIRYGGSHKETSIRRAFENLLNQYCKPRNYMLIAELDFKTKFNTTVRPDGTVKDAIRLEHGWWEAKDTDDVLDEEIEKKFEKGYPDENILFEDSQTAVLIQHGREQARVSMGEAEDLDGLIATFVDYERPEVRDFRTAIKAFRDDIPAILEALRAEIKQAERENQQFRDRRNTFLEVCRQSINPEIEIFDIHEMLIQHILTEDIFTNIFHESQFHRENNIAREIAAIIATFFTGATRRNALKSIEHYYAVIRRKSENIANHHEKQKFLKAIYENFYKAYNPKAADRLGIVYTPNEIVRFMIESADYLKHKHFGKLLSDPGVEILDPCTGTGTYVTELIEYLPADKLEHKFKHEIHCNEVAILPYYIANLNIEFTYQQKMGKYEEFKNICLVDTLDHCTFEGQQFDLFAMSVQNTERISEQNSKNISVIIGNPPYNAWQANFNDANANRSYEEIDKRIKATYVKQGTAQNKISVYDMYTRFYRWASDRIDEGVICFITNSSFLDSRAFDGFRKCIQDEFAYAYFLDCGGNVREISGRDGIFICEDHTIFGEAAMTGIVVGFLIKEKTKEKCQIFYTHPFDIHELREEKIKFIAETPIASVPFEHVTPDKKHNWVNLTDNDFDELLPLLDKQVKAGKSQEAVFKLFSSGVKTQRDEWVYDFSKEALIERMKYFVEVYQERLEDGTRRELDIKWDRELGKYLQRRISKKYSEGFIVPSLYRYFTKAFFYFDRHFNGMTYQIFHVFPNSKSQNKLIGFMGQPAGKPFSVIATDLVPDLNCISPASGGIQCLPLYRYDENGDRIDNITDWGLEQFRQHYRAELDKAASDKGLKPLVPHTDADVEDRSSGATQRDPLGKGQTEKEATDKGLKPLVPPTDTALHTETEKGNHSSDDPAGKGLKPLVSKEPLVSEQWWFVTFVTHNARVSERMVTYGVKKGEPLIFSAEDQIFIAEQIADAAKRYEIAISAFNVLPDHVHMVVAASTEPELNEKIRKIKGFSSHQYQRSHDWDKGQHVWAQKFNRQAIEEATALSEILEYILNNHIKHAERWGDELITTWNEGVTLGNKGLKPLVSEEPLVSSQPLAQIVREACIPFEELFSPGEGTRGLSPLPETVEDSQEITKLDIFHYTYAVLHHPAYRTKYELNLKRDFPRLPYYPNFHQWAAWGKALMDLHLTYETAQPYGLEVVETSSGKAKKKAQAATIPGLEPPDLAVEAGGEPAKPKKTPKAKLKADKEKGHIILDTDTTLTGVPAVAWDYKLGNRSALEWILDQYKEKKPKDPTIRELFNTYKFADYKDHVIDLLQRVCTVSVETMRIIQQMPDAVEHEGDS